MKAKMSILLITMMCVLFGFFSVRALDNQEPGIEIGEVASIRKIEELFNQKNELEAKKKQLNNELTKIEGAIAIFEDTFLKDDNYQLQQDLLHARLLAGLLPLQGPGIEIILNDRPRDNTLFKNPNLLSYFIVHDSDMLDVINELRAAGAEAIAVNGVRIMATSKISCGGPTINVGKYERFAPPFIIHAIGDPDALIDNFQRDDSIYQDLIAWGLEFQLKKMSEVKIPRHLGDIDYHYAKPVREGE